MMRGWRWGWLGLAVMIAVTSTGCEAIKRKITRKRRPGRPTEPIFSLDKEYRPEQPPSVRYQAHFAYWKAAHDDLLDNLGETTLTRRLRATHEAVKQLTTMQRLLDEPTAGRLGRLIGQMRGLEAQLSSPTLDPPRLAVLRSTIESLRRRIDHTFDYHTVKTHIVSDLPSPPAPANAPSAH